MTIPQIAAYTLIPCLALLVGSLLATLKEPGRSIRAAIQHMAAGIVFAAVAIELLPEVLAPHHTLAMVVGFGTGVAAMLALRQLVGHGDDEGTSRSGLPGGLLLTLAIDLLVDGMLVGIAFATGAEQGWVITLALTLEVLFLGLSATVSLTARGISTTQTLLVSLGLASLVLVGSTGGALIAGRAQGQVFTAMLAFGVAALLYLVTEELLVEAHEGTEHEAPWVTAAFFSGFLLVLLLG